MVGGSLTRTSVLNVDLGVGGVVIVSGSHDRPTYSCDGWSVMSYGTVRGLNV
jgi:hypothetical protein